MYNRTTAKVDAFVNGRGKVLHRPVGDASIDTLVGQELHWHPQHSRAGEEPQDSPQNHDDGASRKARRRADRAAVYAFFLFNFSFSLLIFPSFLSFSVPHLEKGDILIDGGNSHFPDTTRRVKARTLALSLLSCVLRPYSLYPFYPFHLCALDSVFH